MSINYVYNRMMAYVGIDFGGKRVGIAISDGTNKLAFPYLVLRNNEMLITEIEKIIEAKKINKIVIGESKDFKGEPNKIMTEIEKFKEILGSRTQMEICYEPEFMTSVEAQHLQGKNKMHDASAAAIILQSYLDRLN